MTKRRSCCRLAVCLLAVKMTVGTTLAQGLPFIVRDEEYSIGGALMPVGDVDGDGVCDILTTMGLWPGPGVPRLVRYYSGRMGTGIRELIEPPVEGEILTALSVIGDLNQDGIGEIICGYSRFKSNRGLVQVHSGSDGALINQFAGPAGTDASPFYGGSVAGIGDVDGDGTPDYAYSGVGHVSVRSGANGSELYPFQGDSKRVVNVGAAGDVNGDGHPDFVINNWNDRSYHGPRTIRVHSGRDGLPIWAWDASRFWKSASSTYGRGVDDLDGDGFDDIAASAISQFDLTGTVVVLSGRNAEVRHTLIGAPHSRFGTSVSGMEDFDGDGWRDLLIGAPYERDNGAVGQWVGAARIFSGRDAGVLWERIGREHDDAVGLPARGLPDLNGDGAGEFAVGIRPGEFEIHSSRCGAITTYGPGCAGTGGLEPRLRIEGCVTPNGRLTIQVDQALGGTIAQLVVGQSATQLPVGGCTLLLFPFVAVVPLPISGSGTGGGLVRFEAIVPMEVPLTPFYLQAIISDPQGPGGHSMTRGVRLEFL